MSWWCGWCKFQFVLVDFSSIKGLRRTRRQSSHGNQNHRFRHQRRIISGCENIETCVKARSYARIYKSIRSFAILLSSYYCSRCLSTCMLRTYPYYKLTALFFGVLLFRQLKKPIFDMVDKPWVVYDEWPNTYGKTFIINGLSPQ